MICPRCKSENVNVVMDTNQKIKKVSLLRRLLRLTLIICTFGLWALFVPAKAGSTQSKPVALCQNCGNKFKT